MKNIGIILLFVIGLSCCNENKPKEKVLKDDISLSPENPFRDLKTKKQAFEITLDEDKEVQGKNGTIIKIPKSALVFENGKTPNEVITIELEEYYQKSSMFFSQLNTLSNNELLESGGMIHLIAKSEGKPLQIRNESSISVSFPFKNKKDDMQLFYGEDRKDMSINWLPTVDNSKNIGLSNNKKSVFKFTQDEPTILEDSVYKEVFNYYHFQASKFGWMNCDRFYDYKDKSSIIVENSQKYHFDIKSLVFVDMNALVSDCFFETDGETCQFAGVPVREKVHIIVIGRYSDVEKNKELGDNDKVLFYHKEFTIEKEPQTIVPVLKEIKREELKKMIEEWLDQKQKKVSA